MNPIFKKRTCDLLGWSKEQFDTIFSEKPFRAVRINPLKTDLATVQANFNAKLKNTPFYRQCR